MAFLIPLPTSNPFFDLLVLLDGTTYTLRFRWNPRAPSAPAWEPSTIYGPGAIVSNTGNVYRFARGVLSLSASSAADGGPTGERAGILDGGVVWDFLRASGSWFLDVLDSTGTTQILSGLRVVADWPLGKNNTGRQPPGALVAQDTSGKGLDPGLDDLGARVRLLYFTSAELAA